MNDQPFADADPLEGEVTQPQVGTSTQVDDPSGGAKVTPEGAAGSPPALDEDFLKRLESLDPKTLPQSFLDKYIPKPDFTRKTQEHAEELKRAQAERLAAFELAHRMLQERQAPQGPTADQKHREELKSLAAAGDADALDELVRLQANDQIQPLRTQMALREAYEKSTKFEPLVAQHWDEFTKIIEGNPALKRLAEVDNYAHADKVMVALGYEKRLQMVLPLLKTKDDEIAALKAKVAEFEKGRVASLPASTSRAGVTTGRAAAGEPDTIEEAAKMAWVMSGGKPEDFR